MKTNGRPHSPSFTNHAHTAFPILPRPSTRIPLHIRQPTCLTAIKQLTTEQIQPTRPISVADLCIHMPTKIISRLTKTRRLARLVLDFWDHQHQRDRADLTEHEAQRWKAYSHTRTYCLPPDFPYLNATEILRAHALTLGFQPCLCAAPPWRRNEQHNFASPPSNHVSHSSRALL